MDTNIEEIELVNLVDEAVAVANVIRIYVKHGLYKRAAEKAELLEVMTKMMAAMSE